MERDEPNYFAIIPANVRYDKNLKDKAKLLYGEITALCNKEGVCWAKNEYFADLYDVTKTTVSTLIKNLIDNGYIKSKLIYKEGTKEILNRYLSIVKDPIKKNLKDNNINIIINKKEEEKEKIIDFYNNNFGLITPYIAENIFSYLEDGLQQDLIIRAMEEAVSNNIRKWNYVKTILNDCVNNQIKTLEQYTIKQREFKNKKANKTTANKKQEVTYNTDFSEYDQYVKRD
jgi:DnaD/phage-associated family protein